MATSVAAYWRSSVLIGVLAAMFQSSPAQAGDDTDSEALVHQGIELRKQGHDDLALPLFERAYAASPSGRTAAQLGLVKAGLGDWVEAERLLQVSFKLGGPWVEKNRPALDGALLTARSYVGDLTVTGTPKGAPVAVDGKVVGTLPMTAPMRLGAGQHHLVVQMSGFSDFARDLAVKGNQADVIDVHLEASRSAPIADPIKATPPPSSEPFRARAVLPWVAGGAAVAALALGALEHLRWSHDTSDFNSVMATDGSGPACAAGAPMHGLVARCGTLYDQLTSARTLTFVGYGAAAALAATSAGLFVWNSRSVNQRNGEVAHACGPDLAHDGWQCIFTF